MNGKIKDLVAFVMVLAFLYLAKQFPFTLWFSISLDVLISPLKLVRQDNRKIIYAKPPNKFSWIETERLLEGLHWTRRKTFDQNPFDAIEGKYTN